MGKETERKFLVTGRFRHLASGKQHILQGYLAVDPERTVRIRLAGKKAFLTIKSPAKEGSFTRGEWEYEIPRTDAEEIMKICLPRRIEKTRYRILHGRHVIEVDEFHGEHIGLVMAEVELACEEEEFEKPEWLGEEVTGDPRYYNANMI
ncbi:MAG: CYTH domain-containing protein [Bacteroidales bacterium]|jgi:adenylate cyclase|nr:CYTH domain-containing protein [Bacteroidales bacterium]